jgi:hypothetical protein
MNVLSGFLDKIGGRLQGFVGIFRHRLFGANNEKLDFLMDSFYKLNPNQRTGVLAGLVAFIGVFVLGAFALYFSQVNRLKDDLSNSFAALHELQALKAAYDIENKNFEKLVEVIQRRTKQTSLKPFFEKTGNDLGVTIEALSDQKTPVHPDNPLADKMQEVRVNMRLPNISIPRLLSFLVEIEKSNRYLRVQDLEIKGKYGTKLYFDSEVKVRGYDLTN